jgi:hypothetical protein
VGFRINFLERVQRKLEGTLPHVLREFRSGLRPERAGLRQRRDRERRIMIDKLSVDCPPHISSTILDVSATRATLPDIRAIGKICIPVVSGPPPHISHLHPLIIAPNEADVSYGPIGDPRSWPVLAQSCPLRSGADRPSVDFCSGSLLCRRR